MVLAETSQGPVSMRVSIASSRGPIVSRVLAGTSERIESVLDSIDAIGDLRESIDIIGSSESSTESSRSSR